MEAPNPAGNNVTQKYINQKLRVYDETRNLLLWSPTAEQFVKLSKIGMCDPSSTDPAEICNIELDDEGGCPLDQFEDLNGNSEFDDQFLKTIIKEIVSFILRELNIHKNDLIDKCEYVIHNINIKSDILFLPNSSTTNATTIAICQNPILI